MASRSRRDMSGKCQTNHTGGPAGLRQTQTFAAGGKKTFEHQPASGQVLVVMRYKREMDRRMRNCIIRMKGRIRQPGTEGSCLGITDKVRVLECTEKDNDWAQRDDWCIALFLFPSEKHARRWYDSEPEVKQHDFLPPSDGVQLFIVKLRYMPRLKENGKLTFNWIEMRNVQSNNFLQREFVDKAAQLLDDQQVNHGLIFLQDPNELGRLKDSWISHNSSVFGVVHVFDSEEQFSRVFHQDVYADLRKRRAEVCDTISFLFTIDSNITGPPTPRS